MNVSSPPPGLTRQPVFNAPPVVLWICGVVLACSSTFFFLSYASKHAVLRHIAITPYDFLTQFSGPETGPSILGFLPLVTHVLLHADLLHLMVNLGFLLAFGTAIERSCGGLQMLAIFLLSAVAGAAVQVWAMGLDHTPIIGASGGVYGLMGAIIPLLVLKRIERRLRRVVDVVLIIMLMNLVFAVSGVFDVLSGMQIAWEAHFGGFAAGAFIGFLAGQLGRSRKQA